VGAGVRAERCFVSDRSKLLLLAPLALASAALALRESRRSAAPDPPAPGPIVTLTPPPILLALSCAGNWSVVAQESALQLSQDGLHAEGVRGVDGSVSIGAEGDLARLDLSAELDPDAVRELLGNEAGATLELHAEPARSFAACVPGVRRAELNAQMRLGELRREVQLRAYWIPSGPGRLRLQLAASWDDQTASMSELFAAFATGPQRSTLALDLALARS
jgi:hypothetical protein